MKTRLIIEVSVIQNLSSCQIWIMGSSFVQALLFFQASQLLNQGVSNRSKTTYVMDGAALENWKLSWFNLTLCLNTFPLL